MLEGLEALQHRKQREIHRSHVERGDLRRKNLRRLDPFFHAHGGGAAGGNVDDAVGALLDDLQERGERLRRLVRASVDRIAGVKVDDRGAGFGRLDGCGRDLLGRHRQVGRHRRGMDRSCERAGDDDLVLVRHFRDALALSLLTVMREMNCFDSTI